MGNKLPAFQFYPGDWIKDPNLRRCSHAAKGVWIDVLCLMFECEERGVLATAGTAWSDEEIARAVGGDQAAVLVSLSELTLKGVAKRRQDGSLYSKRLVTDEHKRRLCSEAGKRGGNPTLKGRSKGGPKGVSKGGPKPNPTPSSSSSSSDSPQPPTEGGSSEVKGMEEHTDELDTQIHRFCATSPHVMPSPKVYGEIRKMVVVVGWDETKRLIADAAKQEGVISASAVALSRVSRKQAAGEAVKKPRVAEYVPVTGWKGG